jgi:transglutaminase-like putative cysteine protease
MLLVAVVGPLPAEKADSTPLRRFEFTYVATIPTSAPGAQPLRLWMPLPQSNDFQDISNLRIVSPFPYSVQKNAEYGNELLYMELPAATAAAGGEVRLTFDVTRREHRVALGSAPTSEPADALDSPELRPFLKSDRLVPIDGRIAQLSAQTTQGITNPLAKVRAIYDYVVATMRYDKSGTGWGNGDALWACDSKRGNCTDFHSLFIGMARAAGIPARFEIGFPLPDNAHDGVIPGYHCWAEFYVQPYGWVPVDASEAWKHPDHKNYFFGAHDSNRVQFTVGRDLILKPAQQGPPLNYLIYPYAEQDGKPVTVAHSFSFQDN